MCELIVAGNIYLRGISCISNFYFLCRTKEHAKAQVTMVLCSAIKGITQSVIADIEKEYSGRSSNEMTVEAHTRQVRQHPPSTYWIAW